VALGFGDAPQKQVCQLNQLLLVYPPSSEDSEAESTALSTAAALLSVQSILVLLQPRGCSRGMLYRYELLVNEGALWGRSARTADDRVALTDVEPSSQFLWHQDIQLSADSIRQQVRKIRHRFNLINGYRNDNKPTYIV
jgi:hypothetical protein